MSKKVLLIRGDDFGVTHAVNMGFKKFAEKGMLSAWSIMAPCPWFTEAVEIARKFPEIDLGMHLTLMSEWNGYRWAPILGADRVPSLVDKDGYFFPSTQSFILAKPKKEEVEAELRAQVERVLATGLTLRYVDDGHGFHGQMIPMTNEIFNRIIKDYHLQASNVYSDPTQDILFAAEPTKQAKLAAFKQWIATPFENTGYRLLVIHPTDDYPEQRELVLNYEIQIPTLREIISHNIADTKAILSDEFIEEFKKQGYELIRYRDLGNENASDELFLYTSEMVEQVFASLNTDKETIDKLIELMGSNI